MKSKSLEINRNEQRADSKTRESAQARARVSAKVLSIVAVLFGFVVVACWYLNIPALAQVYLFAENGDGTLLSRFFFSKAASVLEDPATGSATANLGGWYLAQQATVPLTRVISQGEHAGRPSTLRLRIDEAGQVFVAGAILELGRGEVDL